MPNIEEGEHLKTELSTLLGEDGAPVLMDRRHRRIMSGKTSAHPKPKKFNNERHAGKRLQIKVHGLAKLERLFARAGVKLNLMP